MSIQFSSLLQSTNICILIICNALSLILFMVLLIFVSIFLNLKSHLDWLCIQHFCVVIQSSSGWSMKKLPYILGVVGEGRHSYAGIIFKTGSTSQGLANIYDPPFLCFQRPFYFCQQIFRLLWQIPWFWSFILHIWKFIFITDVGNKDKRKIRDCLDGSVG